MKLIRHHPLSVCNAGYSPVTILTTSAISAVNPIPINTHFACVDSGMSLSVMFVSYNAARAAINRAGKK